MKLHKPLLFLSMLVLSSSMFVGCANNTSTSNNAHTLLTTIETQLREDMSTEINQTLLTNREVEFNKAGNLDKPFAFVGRATLDDYYNYGYRDTSDTHFCVEIEPIDGSGDWHLYYFRPEWLAEVGGTDSAAYRDMKKLYDELMAHPEGVDVFTLAMLPKEFYDSNQDNLASGMSVIPIEDYLATLE